MKKTYAKPQLYAEEFQLVEHITLTCAKENFTAHHSTGWTCSIEWDDHGTARVMFTDKISGCASATGKYDESWQNDEFMESYYNDTCYNSMQIGPMFSS